MIEESSFQKVEPSCVHYWMMGPINGGISSAECRLCGVTRQFSKDASMPVQVSPRRPAAARHRRLAQPLPNFWEKE